MPSPSPQFERRAWIGLLLTLALAAGLYTRFSIDDRLSRDEAIWVYGAQQFVEGVPYYKSIFDAKTPLAPALAAGGVEVARITGGSDIHGVRIVFLLFACAAAAGMYALGRALWGSVLAGALSAVAFLAFKGFAIDALGGPDAKTPGIAFAVFSMLALVRRRWLLGGALGALAFLCWQPFGIHMLVAPVAALAMSARGSRARAASRAIAGAVVPVAASFVYFWAANGLSDYVDAAFRFPVEGVHRAAQTTGDRVRLISDVVGQEYGVLHGWLLWGGLIALGVALVVAVWRGRRAWRTVVANPLICVVAPPALALIAFTLHDFEGYPDVYPLLPFAALGAGATALLARRRALGAGLAAAAAALAGFTWHDYATAPPSIISLGVQQDHADGVRQLLGPRGRLYAIGDPTSLVLTHRRNPNRYIYLGSGVLQWMVDRTPGGLGGWLASIRALDPGVIVVHTFHPKALAPRAFLHALRQGYESRWLGTWHVLVKPPLLRRAEAGGLVLSTRPPPPASTLGQPPA
jgi:hypothetical protein